MKKLYCIIAYFYVLSLHSQPIVEVYEKGPSGDWPLRFDIHASAFTGSSIISSLNNAFFWSEDRLLDSTGIRIKQPWSGILRSLEMVLLVLPINDFLFLWQHEFFGHGARAREFGFKTSWPKYDSLPLPFGLGLGSITYEGKPNKLQSLLIAHRSWRG